MFAAGLLLLSGCVSKSDYEKVIEQNKALRKSVQSAEERIRILEKQPERSGPETPAEGD